MHTVAGIEGNDSSKHELLECTVRPLQFFMDHEINMQGRQFTPKVALHVPLTDESCVGYCKGLIILQQMS